MKTLEPTTKRPTTEATTERLPSAGYKINQMRLMSQLGYCLPNESNACLREIESNMSDGNWTRLRELAADADALWRVAEWAKRKLPELQEEHLISNPAWQKPNPNSPQIIYGPGYELVRIDYASEIEREAFGSHCRGLFKDAAREPGLVIETRGALYFDWEHTCLSFCDDDESETALLIDRIVEENRP